MSSPSHQTFSLRVTTKTLERIDAAAEREGVSRNAYMLSWLPEAYEQPTADNTETAPSNGIAAHR